MAVVFILLTLLLPLPVGNDAQLVVTVHDERGVGVAGILVAAHAAADQAVIAQAHTDTMGQAVFPNITAPRVHILLTGTTATGVPLRLQGHDAGGITLHLHGTDTTLALRVERNGTVIVDPTSWAQESVTTATNTAAATTAPLGTPITSVTESPPPARAQSALPLVLLLVLLGLVAVLVLRARRPS